MPYMLHAQGCSKQCMKQSSPSQGVEFILLLAFNGSTRQTQAGPAEKSLMSDHQWFGAQQLPADNGSLFPLSSKSLNSHGPKGETLKEIIKGNTGNRGKEHTVGQSGTREKIMSVYNRKIKTLKSRWCNSWISIYTSPTYSSLPTLPDGWC